jgi:hypothetical protein
MRASVQSALLAVAFLCSTNRAGGQPAIRPDVDVARVRTEFEYGNYTDALKRASERIDRGNLSEADVIELHKYAGLAAFYLHQKAEAERHLWALLQLDPDYSLDPFVVPPPAMAFFEGLRKEHAQQLSVIREERRRRAELLKESEERERSKVEAEEQRRRLEELARQASTTQVHKQSFVVNFIPFGMGQFQQGRTKTGVIFAVTEGVLALTSIVAFLEYNSLIQEQTITLDDRLTPDRTYTLTQQGIPPAKEHQANIWRGVKYGSAGAFWVTYAVGVVDAIIHHRSEIVTSTRVVGNEPANASGLASGERNSTGLTFSGASAGVGTRVGLSF